MMYLASFIGLLFLGVCYGQTEPCIFRGWDEYRSSCTDGIRECTTPSCQRRDGCMTACQYDRECHGYQWLERSRRCGHYRPNSCTSTYAGIVSYKRKKCNNDITLNNPPNSGPFTVRRGGEENVEAEVEFSRGCPRDCGDIPYVEDALHDGKNTQIGSKVTYFCKKGFRLTPSTSRTIKCDTHGKWEPAPKCEEVRRRIVD